MRVWFYRLPLATLVLLGAGIIVRLIVGTAPNFGIATTRQVQTIAAAPTRVARRVPTLTPNAQQMALDSLRTPAPAARARLSSVSEVAAPTRTPAATRVLVRTVGGPLTKATEVYITDRTRGQELRLGDDSGGALFFDADNRYVVWGVRCHCEDSGTPPTSLATGLYIYDLDQQHNVVVPSTRPDHAIITGDWVIYAFDPLDNQPRTGARPHIDRLHAYSIPTAQDVALGTGMMLTAGGGDDMPTEELFTVCGNTVVWGSENAVHIYDLSTRTVPSFTMPDMPRPHTFSCSDSVITWNEFGQGWWVYDRVTQHPFMVTLTPLQVNGQITNLKPPIADGDSLTWSIEVDGAWRSFRAMVER